jgi:hypothetical protein
VHEIGRVPRVLAIAPFYLAAVAWCILAVGFISRTTHVAIDAARYFLLFDDGMISMRYARNLVEHRALVWNLGERVEGFSNPLWTFVMAGAIRLFGTHYAPLAMQILGGLVCLALFAVYFHGARRNGAAALAVVSGLLVLVCSYPLSYWALSGMEASAVSLVFAISLFAQHSYESGNAENPLLLHSLLIALAYCLRPDGWLAISPFFAACAFDAFREKKYRTLLCAVTIPSVVVLFVLVARLAYYGTWVPNTFVLKVEGYRLALRLRNGAFFVSEFCWENFALLVLIALAAFSKRRIAFLNILAVCVVLGYQEYVGGDPWLYWRQLLPIYVSAAFALLLVSDYVALKLQTSPDAPSPPSANCALVAILPLAPVAVFEYLVFLGGMPPIYRRQLLQGYSVLLVAAFIGLRFAARMPGFARNAKLLAPAVQVVVLVVALYSIDVGNARFKPEFTTAPFPFAHEAKLLDKAILSKRLFGSGKTYHVVTAGTYAYYTDGIIIDSLGKSDALVARYPVDEAVAWYGMRGVPGHAKHDFRDTILRRKPDVIVDYTGWGNQNLTKEISGSYSLISVAGVSLCVRNDLAASFKSLIRGNCPYNLL